MAVVRAIAHARRFGHDLVERRVDEVGELDLDDRQQPVQGHPDGDPDDPGFGQGCVDDAFFAELLHPSHGDAEHAAAVADVLAQEDDAVVGGHLVMQRVPDGRDQVLLGHASSPPSANT